MTASECHLNAENYELAARMVPLEDRMRLLEQAAIWRRRAFEMQMLRFEHLREIRDGEPGLAD